ncbi:MAG: TolC family protein [Acidobacteriota bacterium]
MRFMLRLIFISLFLPAFAVAQAPKLGTPSDSKSPKPTATPGAVQPESSYVPEAQNDEKNPRALRLSLDDAVVIAVRQNLGVDISRYDYRITGFNAQAAYGPFDYFATADASRSSSTSPVVSSLQPSEAETTKLDFGLSQLLATGGQYSVGWTNRRSSSNARFIDVNPAYDAGLTFSFNQPLLKNFGVDVTKRQIYIARNNLGISGEAFRNALMLTTNSIEQAYLDLIFARQNLGVKQESLGLAREQSRITQIRIDVGASAPLDILQPNVAIATREEEMITAEAQIRNAEDRLRQLMNLPPEQWDQPIVPTTDIAYTAMPVDVIQAVARAMDLRPEIKQAQLSTEIDRIDALYFRNQLLPKLDFNVDYGSAGQGGTVFAANPITGQPEVVDRTGIGTALEDILNFRNRSWTVGFNFAFPIRNIGAKANARAAELTLERSNYDQLQVKQNVAVQVRQAARDIETLARQIVATRVAVSAADQNVGAERKRFENGLTTNFNVLLIQQQLSDARSNALFALVAYNKAISAYHQAVGDILEVNNIAVQEPQHFDLPDSRWGRYDFLNYSHYTDHKDLKPNVGNQ